GGRQGVRPRRGDRSQVAGDRPRHRVEGLRRARRERRRAPEGGAEVARVNNRRGGLAGARAAAVDAALDVATDAEVAPVGTASAPGSADGIDPATPPLLLPLVRARVLANRVMVAFGMVALLAASLVLTS